ncbi:alpha/beta-hydrolase [Auriscalpium vulgare]|uniref:Alpha/beta-hydrolase n=1 Tax=Auriscalpium vulgare TaxID=40419 RepID=A0ACB8RAB7_9AGAM|nr:alpha/beta-hydrolase [Auriscalpium vulgare]
MWSLLRLVSVAAFSVATIASPAPVPEPEPVPVTIVERAGVTTLSSAQLAAFAPFTQFARAAYCSPTKIQGWNCGEACQAISGFQPTLTGGDGNDVQFWFVGYWPTQNSVVVAHQGTDPTQLLSDLTDLNVVLSNPSQTLFPGIPSDAQVHSGFAAAHAQTAPAILAEVKRLFALHSSTSVYLVGHSLGGALAELDSLFLRLNLPAGTTIKGVTYGTPRVGNPSWAAFFDGKVADFTRVNNEDDVIPIVPGRFLGFSHPHGEVHILSAGNAVSCPGDDDATDAQCTISSVPNVLDGNIIDHLGPYQGIYIGTIFCT